MSDLAKQALSLANALQGDMPRRGKPLEEGARPESEQILPFSLVRGTRGYIERVLNQINGCYEDGWFDACSVMIRRFVETLIVEAFEHHGIADRIQNSSGDFLQLGELIDKTICESSWNLTRNTKKALPKLKNLILPEFVVSEEFRT